MPLDEFSVYPVELDNYAEQLLIAECMAVKGYEWPVPWQDVDFPRAEDFNDQGVRLFNPELAERWGYHFARLEDDRSGLLWREFTETTDAYFPNAELDNVLLDCREELRGGDSDFGINSDGQNYLAELDTQARKVVEQDDAVIEATVRWRECLEPHVDFALPADPWSEMPPIAVAQEWGAVTGGSPEPSTQEIEVATADADCRESSGLSAMTYTRNWEEQEKLVEQNRDELDRNRSAAAERKSRLLTIVAENAPGGP